MSVFPKALCVTPPVPVTSAEITLTFNKNDKMPEELCWKEIPMLSPISLKWLVVSSHPNWHTNGVVIVKKQTVLRNTVSVSMQGSSVHIFASVKTV